MEATIKERKELKGLNQNRTKAKQSRKSKGVTPGTVINVGEFAAIMGVAIVADVVEVPIVGWFVDGIALFILWIWRIFKQQSGPKKDPTFKLLLVLVIEMTPVGIVPTWILYVLYTYYQDKKLAEKGTTKLIKRIKK